MNKLSKLEEAQKTAEKMRRTAAKEAKALTTIESNTPGNYLAPAVVSSISSVKGKDKVHFEKIIARTLLDIILNGVDNKEKMQAIDRYQKLTQSSQILVKNGSQTAAIETQNDQPTTLNLNLSSHVNSNEPEEDLNVTSRDLVAEKNADLFSRISSSPVAHDEIEDAEYEVIDD